MNPDLGQYCLQYRLPKVDENEWQRKGACIVKVSVVEENDRNTYTTNYIPLNVIAVKNPLNNMAVMCP